MSERKQKAGANIKAEKVGLYIELPATAREQVQQVKEQAHRASDKNTCEWIIMDWLNKNAGTVRQAQPQTGGAEN